MSEILKNIVSFFKTRKITASVSPKIEVDYHYWGSNDDLVLALAEDWRKLRVELNNNPSCIKTQKWNDFYSDGMRAEVLTVDIEGVFMTLEGPSEPNPNFVKPQPRPIKSAEQQANESVDEIIRGTSIIPAITHCSDIKYRTLIAFLDASRQTSAKNVFVR
jgi:hypothetical protein